MRSTLNDRLHFLIYAYFGVDDTSDDIFEHIYNYDTPNNVNDDLPDSLIHLAAKKAYGDLKRRVPYVLNATEMERSTSVTLKNMKEDFKSDVYSHLIEQLRGFEHQDTDLCELIRSVSAIGDNYPGLFKPNHRFTIGLSQKWVNMTLKYLWILGVIDGENLHVPIDSYIIKAATSTDNNLCLGIDYNYQNNRKSSWSSWDDIDEYSNFQMRIRNEIANRYPFSPIKWENDAWIEIANLY